MKTHYSVNPHLHSLDNDLNLNLGLLQKRLLLLHSFLLLSEQF